MATWAKSSQYRGMPHQQYMQTEEGQRSNQFFREDAQRMREGRNTPQRTGFATGHRFPDLWSGGGRTRTGMPHIPWTMDLLKVVGVLRSMVCRTLPCGFRNRP